MNKEPQKIDYNIFGIKRSRGSGEAQKCPRDVERNLKNLNVHTSKENSPKKLLADSNTPDNSDRILVRLYHMENGEWQDYGFLGYLSLLTESESPFKMDEFRTENSLEKAFPVRGLKISLRVIDKETLKLIMTHLASKAISYKREKELISWKEGTEEIAISFLSETAAEKIFDLISKVDINCTYKEDVLSPNKAQKQPKNKACKFNRNIKDDGTHSKDKLQNPENLTPHYKDEILLNSFPDPSIANLESMAEVLIDPIENESQWKGAFENKSYLRKMFDLFSQLEDLGNLESLGKVFSIFKSLLYYGNPAVVENMLHPKHIETVLQIIDYSPKKILKAISEKKDFCPHYQFSKSAQQNASQYPIILPKKAMEKIIHLKKLSALRDFVYYRPANNEAILQKINELTSEFLEELLMCLLSGAWISKFYSSFLKSINKPRHQNEKYCKIIKKHLDFLKKIFLQIKKIRDAEKPKFINLLLSNHRLFESLNLTLEKTSPETDSEAEIWTIAIDLVSQIASLQFDTLSEFSEELMFNDSRCNKLKIFSRVGDVITTPKDSSRIEVLIQISGLFQKLFSIEIFEMVPQSDIFLAKMAALELPKITVLLKNTEEFIKSQLNEFRIKTADKTNEKLKLEELNRSPHVEAAFQSLEYAGASTKMVSLPSMSLKFSRMIFQAVPLLKSKVSRLEMASTAFLKNCIATGNKNLVNSVVLNNTLPELVDLYERNGVGRENMLSATILDFFSYAIKDKTGALLEEMKDLSERTKKFENISVFKKLNEALEVQKQEESVIKIIDSEEPVIIKEMSKRRENWDKAMSAEERYFSEEEEIGDAEKFKEEGNDPKEGLIDDDFDEEFIERKTEEEKKKEQDQVPIFVQNLKRRKQKGKAFRFVFNKGNK